MQIGYSKLAVRSIKKLDQKTKQRVKRAIELLPHGDVKKLVGRSHDYRLRVGGYRVLFSLDEDQIIIKDILPRGNAYDRI